MGYSFPGKSKMRSKGALFSFQEVQREKGDEKRWKRKR
jgi:hypothetical protein